MTNLLQKPYETAAKVELLLAVFLLRKSKCPEILARLETLRAKYGANA